MKQPLTAEEFWKNEAFLCETEEEMIESYEVFAKRREKAYAKELIEKQITKYHPTRGARQIFTLRELLKEIDD